MPTSSRSVPCSFFASALFVLFLANCSDGAQGDPALVGYLKNTWGITLTGFEGGFTVAEDGTQSYDGTGKITVDGLGSLEMSAQTFVSPVAQGGDTTLLVKNIDGSNERYFIYNQVKNNITIGGQTKGVAVSKNAGNTYEVWAFNGDSMDQLLTVPNGLEALKIVEQYNEFKTISPHILLTAFAFAQAPGLEARINIKCVDNTAATPPVCDIFKEFCNCAACLVLNRRGACAQCPGL